MVKQNPTEFAFVRRRAQQLLEEGITAGAVRLLRVVDEAQVRRFEAAMDEKVAEETGEQNFVSTHFR